MSFSTDFVLYDFAKDSDLRNWIIVDDAVMGGRSQGRFELNTEGHGLFHGRISLENNGGFSSVRYRFDQIKMNDFTKVKIRLKGDGNQYQFRLKSYKYDRHTYVYDFKTTGDWQTISIPLAEMTPQFRGIKLNMQNYPVKVLEEVGLLIANKREETFALELDSIVFE